MLMRCKLKEEAVSINEHLMSVTGQEEVLGEMLADVCVDVGLGHLFA